MLALACSSSTAQALVKRIYIHNAAGIFPTTMFPVKIEQYTMAILSTYLLKDFFCVWVQNQSEDLSWNFRLLRLQNIKAMETVTVKDSLNKTVGFRHQRRCNAVPKVESGRVIHNPRKDCIMVCFLNHVIWL